MQLLKKQPAKSVTASTRPDSGERKLRQSAVDFARRSVRLEGFVVSPLAEALHAQYIDGEITTEQGIAALDAHYKK